MRILRIYLSLTALALLFSACASPGASAARKLGGTSVSDTSAADCPITLASKRFVPPEPWPEYPPMPDRYWYGDEGLWTALPADGSWAQLARGEKFWWWSAEFDVSEDPTPDLTVTATRLDEEGLDFRTSDATNGYHESFDWAMLVGVELPSPGCWQFTGAYKGHSLSFILWVPEK